MKKKNVNPHVQDVYQQTNKLLLTGYMIISLTAGWLLGSITTNVFSQSGNNNEKNITLPLLNLNGEILPTIFLAEYSVVSEK